MPKESVEIKIRTAILNLLKTKAEWVGDEASIKEKTFFLADEFYELFLKLNKEFPPTAELSTVTSDN